MTDIELLKYYENFLMRSSYIFNVKCFECNENRCIFMMNDKICQNCCNNI